MRCPSFLAAAAVLGAGAPLAEAQLGSADVIAEVKIEQRLGAQLPLDARFVDDAGREIELGELFGERPVVLAFVYYECPMLCKLVLDGLVTSLKPLAFDVGTDFDVIAISIDPGETAELAGAAKADHVDAYGRPETAPGWHFLSGTESEIERVAEAAGFRYVYDPVTDEYAHAAAILVATPTGELSRYFYGVEYGSRDLRLGLVEASAGEIGSLTDAVLLLCFHYDPTTGKYGLVIMRTLRFAGGPDVARLRRLHRPVHRPREAQRAPARRPARGGRLVARCSRTCASGRAPPRPSRDRSTPSTCS